MEVALHACYTIGSLECKSLVTQCKSLVTQCLPPMGFRARYVESEGHCSWLILSCLHECLGILQMGRWALCSVGLLGFFQGSFWSAM